MKDLFRSMISHFAYSILALVILLSMLLPVFPQTLSAQNNTANHSCPN